MSEHTQARASAPVQALSKGEISYLDEGYGPPVLLLHSLGTSNALWEGVVSRLSDSFRLIVPDLLGHGVSSPPRAELTIPDHADVLVEFMAALDIPRCPVVGTSLGGLIALDMCARYGARVSALVMNGVPGWHLESQRMARFGTIASSMVGLDGLVRPDATGGGTIRPLTEDQVARRRLDLDRAGRWFLSSLWAVASFDPISRLDRVEAPTLILMGAADFHMSTSYALHDGIRSSRMRVLPGAGHLTPLDDPDGVASELRSFLATISEG